MELQQMIYETLLTQIQFGTFRYMDSLAAAVEVSERFHVSVDTIQSVYRRLKREGYISLSRNVGAKVIVSFNAAEIDQHIQTFFSLRKDAMLDLCSSIQPLLGRIQWLSMKHASPQTLENIERLTQENERPPYMMWQYFEQKYAALNNALLTRLARQIFLFFQTPLFSVAEPETHLIRSSEWVRDTLELCWRQDWAELQRSFEAYQMEMCVSLHDFYRERITLPSPEEQIPFRWSSYKKPGQLCYSLAMELLTAISRGVYPSGSLLPTMERISAEKGVSISTVRRTMGLLCGIGAVKSSRPYGMRVLPLMQGAKNCDFTNSVIRQRLLDMLESLQIFALSCRAVAELALQSLDADSIREWKRRLCALKESPHYDILPNAVLELVTDYVPSKAIQVVYTELLQQFFWGNPLRGMKGDRTATNTLLEPYLTGMITCLKNADIPGFCGRLEELLLFELRDSKARLLQLGIQEANAILIPENDDQ